MFRSLIPPLALLAILPSAFSVRTCDTALVFNEVDAVVEPFLDGNPIHTAVVECVDERSSVLKETIDKAESPCITASQAAAAARSIAVTCERGRHGDVGREVQDLNTTTRQDDEFEPYELVPLKKGEWNPFPGDLEKVWSGKRKLWKDDWCYLYPPPCVQACCFWRESYESFTNCHRYECRTIFANPKTTLSEQELKIKDVWSYDAAVRRIESSESADRPIFAEE